MRIILAALALIAAGVGILIAYTRRDKIAAEVKKVAKSEAMREIARVEATVKTRLAALEGSGDILLRHDLNALREAHALLDREVESVRRIVNIVHHHYLVEGNKSRRPPVEDDTPAVTQAAEEIRRERAEPTLPPQQSQSTPLVLGLMDDPSCPRGG